MFAGLRSLLTGKNITIGLLAVAVAGFLIYRSVYSDKNTQGLVTVVRGDIKEEVIVTGNVEPASDIKLAFEKGGRVTQINADVGNKVQVGEALVVLDSSELSAQLAQAQANIDTQQAKLDSLKLGKAQQDLANDYAGVINTLNDSYSKADDAVRNQVDQFINNPYSYLSQTQTALQNDRTKIGTALSTWRGELNALSDSSANDALDQALKNGQARLQIVMTFLNEVMDAVINSTTPSATYKTAITTARTEVALALTNLNTLANTISAQKLAVAQNPQDISSQQAVLTQAQANVALIQAQLAKTVLRSPINGTVTAQNANVGEIAAANITIVSVISGDRLQIEANVAEVDIAKIKVGDPAEFTLDAYGNNIVFEASVISIDPAQTIVEGVATYKTKLKLAKTDDRIKPGMTANLTILTNEHQNVLVIPQRSSFARNGKIFVLLFDGKNTVERQVQTGLRGSDGNVEVTQGLNEGNEIVAIPSTQ